MSAVEPLEFDGETYDPRFDLARLAGLLGRVRDLMADGQWRTLADIVAACGGTEASVSARLRDLRKERFGAHNVERRRNPFIEGLFEYRVAGKIEAPPATLSWTLLRDASGWPYLESRERDFTVARVVVPVEGKPTVMYEAWDCRERPARKLGMVLWQDEAKTLAERAAA